MSQPHSPPKLSTLPIAHHPILVLLTYFIVLVGVPFAQLHSNAAPQVGKPQVPPANQANQQRQKQELWQLRNNAVAPARSPYVVLGYNDLGMHCMNQNFSELCILPPFNTLRAQVIYRGGEEPKIVKSGVSVRYSIPGNTISSNKTNFWQYSKKLFGVNLQPNIGLTGNGLAGFMKPTGDNDWSATGIPMTPLTDKMQLNPYQLSQIEIIAGGKTQGTTVAVVPVSWEINCNLCHNTPGITVETDILRKHDKIHGTKLELAKPVLCASCHADAALGTPGEGWCQDDVARHARFTCRQNVTGGSDWKYMLLMSSWLPNQLSERYSLLQGHFL